MEQSLWTDRNRWYTLKEIVAYTHLSQSTIRRAIARGELKCSQATGKYLFKLDKVDMWLE